MIIGQSGVTKTGRFLFRFGAVFFRGGERGRSFRLDGANDIGSG